MLPGSEEALVEPRLAVQVVHEVHGEAVVGQDLVTTLILPRRQAVLRPTGTRDGIPIGMHNGEPAEVALGVVIVALLVDMLREIGIAGDDLSEVAQALVDPVDFIGVGVWCSRCWYS